MAQVALSTEFLQAFAAVPRAQQKKVRAFVEKFKADPTQTSINYEPIHGMADDKVRTVRIGDDYRAIVIHPPQGDVYLCVWVDHHDEAMAWAKHKHFEVNARTGTLQVWESQTIERHRTEEKRSKPPPRAKTLFRDHADETLLAFGVPTALMPSVRAIVDEAGLDHLARYLPNEARDALYFLAAGYSAEATLEELAKQPIVESESANKVDVSNFSAALAKPESQRQFKLINSESELADILDAPLAQWRIFLHPSQRKLVQLESQGPVRVLGGAGTGKTVVAMHRARALALRPGFLREGEKILFTTFTKNLATDVARHLDLLCGPERSRIEVKNLHKVATDLLAANGVKLKFAVGEEETRWERVLDDFQNLAFAPPFYRDEWTYVVQEQDITDEGGYLRASRVGRGTQLSRAQRREVWKVLAAYRAMLDKANWSESADAVREARMWLEAHPGATRYRAIVADEVQDFRQPDLHLLRALVPSAPDDLFIVGDAHQRIYGHKANLGRAGISIRGSRSRRLRINYRTTQHIRTWAIALLQGVSVDDLDDGSDDLMGYHSLRVGKPPEVRMFRDATAEAKHIANTIRGWLESGFLPADICVVVRLKKLVDAYQKQLEQAGIPADAIDPDGESQDRTKVRVSTMHRVKGLEFRGVIIASVQKGVVPLERANEKYADKAARAAERGQDRNLMFVAATRARDELVITGSGEPSELLHGEG